MISSVAPTRLSTFYAYLITKIGNLNLKVWCTKIARILRILEQTWQCDWVTGIITYGLLYFWKNKKLRGD